MACPPGLYLDFGQTAFLDFSATAPACDLALLGGGQVFQDVVETVVLRTQDARKKVVWGIGISPKDRRSVEFDLLQANCALISTRTYGIAGCDYVPCPSALSPLFDAVPEPQHEVVLFSHARKSLDLQRVPGIPEMNNHAGDMASVIAHLASGATVVTNSYHGTYWAMCLGRKVLCLPFSHKFKQFRVNPVFGDPADWIGQVTNAKAHPEMLEDARAHNVAFYEKVRNL